MDPPRYILRNNLVCPLNSLNVLYNVPCSTFELETRDMFLFALVWRNLVLYDYMFSEHGSDLAYQTGNDQFFQAVLLCKKDQKRV